MLYKITVKRKWTHNNGFCLEEGMTVNVASSKTSSANLLAGDMQEVSDAFMRSYGIEIPKGIRGFASNYLLVTPMR